MNKDAQMQRMAELPVLSVLLRMSLPMMISFFIQALYNIVDSIFVARISEAAFTAVTLAFPMQQVVTAIAVGASTGVSAVWSRHMGQGQSREASEAIRTMTALSLLFSLLFAALGLTLSGPLFRLQTDDTEIAAMGETYLAINWVFACGTILGKYYERLLVSAGRAVLSMLAMASGAVFNLIFDPLLIFGIGPFPEMGVAGAALATIGGQLFAVVVAVLLNARCNPAVRGDMLRPAFHPRAAAAILRVGLPSIVTMGLSSLTSFFLNQILLLYSTTATAVYGVWLKLQNFCFMPIFGLNNGIVPVLSYNYGTGRVDRVRQAMHMAIFGSAGLMTLLLLLLEAIPGAILTVFSAGPGMREIGMVCLRACVLSLPFAAVSMILSTSMQALDHSRYALVINLLRQCVLLLGTFLLFSLLTRSEKLLWLAVPLTELLTFAVALLFNRRFRRHLRAAQSTRGA